MIHKTCLHCGQEFTPHPRVPLQTYCSAEVCQHARRRLWQAAKRKSDPDYHDNQARAQKAWSERHPEYWVNYRATHPDYTAHNRAAQLPRNGYSRLREYVDPGSFRASVDLSSGHYVITQVNWHGIVKMDVIKILTVIQYTRQPA